MNFLNYNYEEKLSTVRLRESTINRDKRIDEFYSDRSRIIYSTSFRRLQQKAQVFSLESNSGVHTRMTHSLEVSDVGRTLANKIAWKLYASDIIQSEQIAEFVTIVENACLVHDLGNPPFGHFGEAAIQSWSNTTDIFNKVNYKNLFLFEDFKQFDGNPQGIRILLKLHTEHDRFSLNLTSATLLSALKYVRSPKEDPDDGIMKKPGFFYTELDEIEQIQHNANVQKHHRYPLTYIMEAADDIAYCMSDIADGIEKRIITLDEFEKSFRQKWKKTYKKTPCPLPKKIKSFNHDISIPWSKLAMEEVANCYIEEHSDIFNGIANDLLSKTKINNNFKVLKSVSREKLYSSAEAENIELTGFSVITGLLKHYERLLKMPYSDFCNLLNGENPKGYEVEKRLYDRIAKHYIDAYVYAVKKLNKKERNFADKELWLRTHLVIDYISGMTDAFSLSMYQMLEGISIKRN